MVCRSKPKGSEAQAGAGFSMPTFRHGPGNGRIPLLSKAHGLEEMFELTFVFLNFIRQAGELEEPGAVRLRKYRGDHAKRTGSAGLLFLRRDFESRHLVMT